VLRRAICEEVPQYLKMVSSADGNDDTMARGEEKEHRGQR
tara:strand:- start:500 stop:619 length:120 start_codon:yes stop_codon:yes gene_type:complete